MVGKLNRFQWWNRFTTEWTICILRCSYRGVCWVQYMCIHTQYDVLMATHIMSIMYHVTCEITMSYIYIYIYQYYIYIYKCNHVVRTLYFVKNPFAWSSPTELFWWVSTLEKPPGGEGRKQGSKEIRNAGRDWPIKTKYLRKIHLVDWVSLPKHLDVLQNENEKRRLNERFSVSRRPQGFEPNSKWIPHHQDIERAYAKQGWKASRPEAGRCGRDRSFDAARVWRVRTSRRLCLPRCISVRALQLKKKTCSTGRVGLL